MKHIWTTRDGQEIEVKDMTDFHLTNTLRYLLRNGTLDNVAKRLEATAFDAWAYAGDAPDGASYAADGAGDSAMDMANFLRSNKHLAEVIVPDIFQVMLKQAEARGLPVAREIKAVTFLTETELDQEFEVFT